jgi:hypothetical protein
LLSRCISHKGSYNHVVFIFTFYFWGTLPCGADFLNPRTQSVGKLKEKLSKLIYKLLSSLLLRNPQKCEIFFIVCCFSNQVIFILNCTLLVNILLFHSGNTDLKKKVLIQEYLRIISMRTDLETGLVWLLLFPRHSTSVL